MKKKQIKGKTEERYYYNEHDNNQVNRLYHQRKRKKRKLRLKRVGFVLGIILVVAFVLSPYSKVGKIEVNGLKYMEKEDILTLIDVNEKSFHLLVSPSKIRNQLKESGLVEEIQCSKGLFNGLEINIKESAPLAYQENEVNISLIGRNGKIYHVTKDVLQNMHITTRLLNFTEGDYFTKFAKEYVNIPDSIRTLISDVSYTPIEPYDKDLIQFDMIDGKKVLIHDVENLASEMKYYQEILSTKPDACIYDIYGKNVYASECD